MVVAIGGLHCVVMCMDISSSSVVSAVDPPLCWLVYVSIILVFIVDWIAETF